jgi:hypothetical protein
LSAISANKARKMGFRAGMREGHRPQNNKPKLAATGIEKIWRG